MEVEKGLGVLTESQGDNGLHREMVMLLQQVSPSQVYKCMIHTALSTNVAQDRPQRVISTAKVVNRIMVLHGRPRVNPWQVIHSIPEVGILVH